MFDEITTCVSALWRYPVKSLQGEQVTTAIVDGDGLRDDRRWGVRDETTGRILTGRREPRLLWATARVADDGEPEVQLPDGTRLAGVGAATDAALSAWLDRPVALVPAKGAPGAKAEYFADATDDTSDAIEWTMPAGRFVDAAPLLVLTTASLRAAASLHPAGCWDPRRFRPNVLLDAHGLGWVEDAWCNLRLTIGTATVSPRQGCIRCTMVARPQPGLDHDLAIYRTLSHHHGGTLGVWTDVQRSGTINVGDVVFA